MADASPLSITVGGLPGTGTSTACRKIREKTGLPYVYAGQIFRDLARERGMTLAEFGAYAEAHEAIDRDLDGRQVQLLRGGALLLEGRLSGWLAHREGIPAFKAWFHADPYVRAQRIVNREGGDVDEHLAGLREREASERKRYLQFYDIDVSDLGIYDIVVDTSNRTPLEVVEDVLDAYAKTESGKGRWFEFWRR